MELGLTTLLKGFAGLTLGAAILCNLPTRLWLPAERATLQYLSEAMLQTMDGSRSFKEAQELSSLKPQLDKHGVLLYAVVHENFGVKGFQPFFAGEVFYDAEKRFYGPKERWLGAAGFLRLSVWTSIFRARGKHIDGDMKGEGRLLGGVFVIGPGNTGVVFEHRESEWGDHANLTEVMDAVSKMKKD